MAVSSEILGVQEQNLNCANVHFGVSMHLNCAHQCAQLR